MRQQKNSLSHTHTHTSPLLASVRLGSWLLFWGVKYCMLIGQHVLVCQVPEGWVFFPSWILPLAWCWKQSLRINKKKITGYVQEDHFHISSPPIEKSQWVWREKNTKQKNLLQNLGLVTGIIILNPLHHPLCIIFNYLIICHGLMWYQPEVNYPLGRAIFGKNHPCIPKHILPYFLVSQEIIYFILQQ